MELRKAPPVRMAVILFLLKAVAEVNVMCVVVRFSPVCSAMSARCLCKCLSSCTVMMYECMRFWCGVFPGVFVRQELQLSFSQFAHCSDMVSKEMNVHTTLMVASRFLNYSVYI